MRDRWHQDERVVNAVPRISHVRNDDGVLVGTVAAIEEDDRFHVGIARCNPCEPNFSRKVGRYVAVGRARMALARNLGLTERKHEGSRYDLSVTLQGEDYYNFLRAQGVNVPENHPEVNE